MKTQNLAIIIVAGILILAAVFFGGIFLEKNLVESKLSIANSQAAKNEKIESAVNALSSDLTNSIVFAGPVSKIDGQSITLTEGRNIAPNHVQVSMVVNIAGNARIIAGQTNSTATTVQQPPLTVKNIKIGDILIIKAKVLSDGTLQGQSVAIATIVPAPATTKSK